MLNLAMQKQAMASIKGILQAHFPGGFRINDSIEAARFRNFAAGLADIARLSDHELQQHIMPCGFLYGEKVYAVPPEAVSKINEIVIAAIADGSRVIYYACLYEQQRQMLFAANIVTEQMLMLVLESMYPAFVFESEYCTPRAESVQGHDPVCSEALRVWGDAALVSISELAERLPYIPKGVISAALHESQDFVWNKPDELTHLSHVQISEAERDEILRHVRQACQTHGYASLAALPLGDVASANSELSDSAIQNTVFRICLSDEFHQNRARGKILTPLGSTKTPGEIIEGFCRSADVLTLEDLLEFQEELTGQRHDQKPALRAGYNAMVRIDRDTFVAEGSIEFEIAAIDAALDTLISGDYMPIRAMITFATLPYAGRAWNLFLLESYCHRFSKVFHILRPAFNSVNAGVIVRTGCGLNMEDIFIHAVASQDIAIDKAAVLDFLHETGYTGRRSYAKINDLIIRAAAARERMK